MLTPRVPRKLLCLLCACALSAGLWTPAPSHAATEISVATLQQKLQAPFKSDAPSQLAITSFRADFDQQAHIASLKRSKDGHGKVSVRFNADAPAAFRWDYLEPEVQHIISNGKKLWVYLPESNRVMISSIDEHLNDGDDPLLFLRSLDNLDRHFKLSIPDPPRSQSGDQLGDYLLTLTPKQESTYMRNLTLHIPAGLIDGTQPERFPLAGVTILDPNGNTTVLRFNQAKTNTASVPEEFTFRVPPGVEIVRPEPTASQTQMD
ncbi:MAG: outer membrane lipoprotein carrier protein LolA [Desulfuromonadaceae bacterium]|nr:outer membrane lipoprotein carrier protein LolA [Desulfuromonas sp.]MDY0184414.1 outer membrane lipoprotein carrier protein LolA [Desulfuromonadaceae bacterium]